MRTSPRRCSSSSGSHSVEEIIATVRRFGAEIKSANADSSHAFERDLMTRCLQGRMSATDWNEAVRRDFAVGFGCRHDLLGRREAANLCARGIAGVAAC